MDNENTESLTPSAPAEDGGDTRAKNKKGFRLLGLGDFLKRRSKRFIAACAAVAAMTVGFGVPGNFCAMGVDYYYGGRLLCTVAAADDSEAIIGAAARRADMLGVDEPEIEVSAKLTLKKDIIDGDGAVDKILDASPELCRGCIVSAAGTDLFVAEDINTVEAALDSYYKKYSLNEEAEFSADISAREELVRKDELTAAEDIVPLLEAGGVLTVLSSVTNVEYSPIPYETTQVTDSEMYLGDTAVETPGVEGQTATTVQSIYSNDQLLSASVINTETVTEPVTEVVRVGSKPRNALEDGLSYPLPVSGVLTSGFGSRWGRAHRGVDLAVDTGTSVYAAAAGTVITAKYNDSYGNYVQIDHGYGIVTTYAHLSSIGVSVGQVVTRGQFIALSGNTGNSTGPHLHFELIDNGNYINPLEKLR